MIPYLVLPLLLLLWDDANVTGVAPSIVVGDVFVIPDPGRIFIIPDPGRIFTAADPRR